MSFNIKCTILAIQNIIPAIIGFITMSNAAALPVLTSGAMENSKDHEFT